MTAPAEIRETEIRMSNNCCETCSNYIYDDVRDEYYCNIDMDEDDMARFVRGYSNGCPYYDFYDEYKIVRKQN